MRKALALVAALALGAAVPAGAGTDGNESYALMFRGGTLDAVSPETVLLYSRAVTSPARPDAAKRATGTLALGRVEGDPTTAEIAFRQGDAQRVMGRFPASVGNPMIMVFYETVVRDMAEAAGGSPFYIRNRVKEALAGPGERTEGEAVVDGRTVPTVAVTLRPFEGDPNAARMQGFGNLELRVTMSEEVPGWYLSLVAEAAPEDPAAPVYRSETRFEGVEAAP